MQLHADLLHVLEFFAIVGRDLDSLNPVSHDKPMLLGEYYGSQAEMTIFDVRSGKGYLLWQRGGAS